MGLAALDPLYNFVDNLVREMGLSMGNKLPFGLLTVGLVIASYAFGTPPGAKNAASAKPTAQKAATATKEQPKSQVRVKISKETTYITEPLRPDGYPDYVAALNQRFSAGVTPENNSAVLFWKALGPAEIPQQIRGRFFAELGMPQPSEQGIYFACFSDYIRTTKPQASYEEQTRYREMLEASTMRPWKAGQFPVVAEWLKDSERPLALVIEATKRPRFSDPVIPWKGDRTLHASLLGFEHKQHVAKALAARAMLKLDEGKIAEAWGDLIACHRWARLVAQGLLSSDIAIANRIEHCAIVAEQAVARSTSLSPKVLTAMADDLDALPPLRSAKNAVCAGERLILLDATCMAVCDGWNTLYPYGCLCDANRLKDPGAVLGYFFANWNSVLRSENAWFDSLAEAGRKPVGRERVAAIRAVDNELWNKATGSFFFDQLGYKIICSLLHGDVADFLIAEDCEYMNLTLTKLAFSLAAYRADHRDYPEKLGELVPKYAKTVPKDVFNDADLHYRRHYGGYLLYSVGINGKDDGGPSVDDCKDQYTVSNDDQVVRVPGKK